MDEISNLKTLFDELTENPDKVNTLTAEQITELRRYNNPYGPANRVEDAEGYVCLSVTNLQEKYLERLYMVALTSFLYRVRQEYDLDDAYQYYSKKSDLYGEFVSKKNIKTELNGMIIPDNNASLINRADESIREYMTNKMGVFEDFSNLHVVAEELRNDLVKQIKEFRALGNTIERKMKEFHTTNDTNTDNGDTDTSNTNKASYSRKRNELKELNAELEEKIQSASAALNKFNDHKKYMNLRLDKYVQGEVRRFLDYYFKYNPKIHLQMDRDPVENDRYRKFFDFEPKTELPSNIFESFRLYKSANYDENVKEVEALWALKPEIENTITVFEDGFETLEEAMAYKDKNKDIFTVQVHIVKKGSPYFLASYKANRDKLEYYNKHTEILKAIETRVKEDEKVGEKLLKKRVRRIKESNIEKEGETSEGMAKYMKENPSAASTMGAQRFDILEENEVLEIPIHRTDAKGMTSTSIFVEADGEVVSNVDENDPSQASSSSATPKSHDSRPAAVKSHVNRRLGMSELGDE
jgi:hypothetical protein